jgi:hypothetical protein
MLAGESGRVAGILGEHTPEAGVWIREAHLGYLSPEQFEERYRSIPAIAAV